MRWDTIYQRLTRDRNDHEAWDMLQAGCRAWARADRWNRGWTAVDDAVAESCADVVLAIDKARGADTFAGFARGVYLNVRRRVIAAARVPVTTLEGIDPPALPE